MRLHITAARLPSFEAGTGGRIAPEPPTTGLSDLITALALGKSWDTRRKRESLVGDISELSTGEILVAKAVEKRSLVANSRW